MRHEHTGYLSFLWWNFFRVHSQMLLGLVQETLCILLDFAQQSLLKLWNLLAFVLSLFQRLGPVITVPINYLNI